MIDIATGLKLPVDLPTRRVSLVGMSGAGKSNALRRITEQIAKASAPFTFFDRLGASYGLRSSADGKGPGLPVAIFGGYHADVEIGATHGVDLARELYESNAAAIIDLSAFTDEEACLFYAAHVQEMLRLHRRAKRVRAMITDEAQSVAPQMSTSKADFMSTVALQSLHTGGRSSGLGCITATQSAAEQAKKTMKQSELFIALRTFSPLDQAPVRDYLRTTVEKKRAAEVQITLSALVDGEAWFISPAWLGLVERHRFHLSETFDSSRTPEIGETLEEPKVFAVVDLDRLRATFKAAAPDDDEFDDSDGDELRARIEDLEEQLRNHAPAESITIETPVFAEGEVDRLISGIDRLHELGNDLRFIADGIGEKIAGMGAPTYPQQPAPARTLVPAFDAAMETFRKTSEGVPIAAKPAASGDLGKGERAILNELAGHRNGRATRVQVGMLAGYTSSGGSFQKYVSTLKSRGFLEVLGRDLAITEAGLSVVGPRPRARTSDDVTALWRQKLGGGERKMLDVLIAIFPGAISRRELGERSGYVHTAGTYQKYQSNLKRLDLIDVSTSGVRAATELFPTGPLKSGGKK